MRPLALALMMTCAGCSWGPPASLACSDFAKARCQRRSDCSNGFNIPRAYVDWATCLLREQLSCEEQIAAPSAGATIALAEDCAIAYPSLSCSDLYATNLPPSCVYRGKLSIGAKCTFGSQCESTFCSGNRTSQCGVCAPPPADGAPCQDSNCTAGQSCDERTLLCRDVPTAVGMSCDNNALPCGSDLSCVGDPGTCQASLQTEGAPCGGSLGECDAQLALSCLGLTATRTCTPFTAVTNGEPCGALPDGSLAVCIDGGNCYSSTGVTLSGEVGVCKAAAADGQPCDSVVGPECLTPARCIVGSSGTAGVCALPSTVGCR